MVFPTGKVSATQVLVVAGLDTVYTGRRRTIFQTKRTFLERVLLTTAAVLGSGRERLFILILRAAADALRNFLANDTQSGPGYRGEPLRGDFLFTIEASPKIAAIEALQGSSNFAQSR